MGNAKDKMAEAQEQYDFRAVLDAVWKDLADELELTPVLKELEKRKVFRKIELRDIQERHCRTEKIRALLQGLREGDYTRYVEFKRCLGASGQQRLVDTIEKVEKGEYKPVVRKELRTEEDKLLEAAHSKSRVVEIGNVRNEPRTEEEELLEDLIAYYLDNESTMPVAPLVEQHDEQLTKFYVRPPMMAYKEPNAFGQVKQSTTQEKTKISSYRELLIGDNCTYKRIYLTADAGMGKTSFSKMLARTWCQAHKPDKDVAAKFSKDDLDTLRKFDFLFLIKLREYQGKSMCCLGDMIVTMLQSKLPRTSSYTNLFVEQVLCNRPCLIIVDGLDEWSHPEHTPSQDQRPEVIPHTSGLPDCCSVLTTTRPWKLIAAQLSKADIDRQVEISELDDDTASELESRAIEILKENQGHNDQVTDFKSSVKVLGHIRYIPFVLLQMICLWFENSPIGKSLCEVYSNIIELILTRWLVKTDSRHTDCECKPSKENKNIRLKCMENNRHCQRYMPLLFKIGELAFSTLFNVIREESLLFGKENVLKYLSEEELKLCFDIGLLSRVKDTTSHSEERLQLYFPHKTLHEFFSALFIATNCNNADTGTMFIKQSIFNKCTSVADILEMLEVFVFVCGLNPEVYSDISRHFATVVSTDQCVIDYRKAEKYSSLFEDSSLLKEYQDMQISCFLESTRNQHPECKILIEDMFVHFDINGYIMGVENQALEKILPDSVRRGPMSLNILYVRPAGWIVRILPDSACSMKSLTLTNLPSAGGIVQILEQAEFPCLERLSVQSCELTVFQSVLTTVPYTLKYLTLCGVPLTDDMCSAISRLNNLQGFYLFNVKVSCDRSNAVSDCISGCMSLQKVKLDLRDWPSGTDEKPEQREANINSLLRSIEAKTLLNYLSLNVHYLDHQNSVLDLSKHDKLQKLELSLPLRLHINTELLVECLVIEMSGISASALSSLLAELHGAPVLETLALLYIRNVPPRIDITALPRLREFTLRNCDLGDSTVTVSPELTSLKTIRLDATTVNMPCYRELFLSISKLPQPITVILLNINMTAGKWRELLFDILGKLPKSVHVEIHGFKGQSEEEEKNIVDDIIASPAFCVTRNVWHTINGYPLGSTIYFDTVVV